MIGVLYFERMPGRLGEASIMTDRQHPDARGESKQLDVLLLGDSESEAELLELTLIRADFAPDIVRVEHEISFRRALLERDFDVVIADYDLPSFNGLEALAIYRESGLELPFLFLSGTMGEEQAVAAMRAGAHDYLLKDRLDRLGPALRRELGEVELRRFRQRDLELLVASERRFTAIFQNSPVAIAVVNLDDGRVSDVNPAAVELFDRPRSELVGMQASELGAWPGADEEALRPRDADASPVRVFERTLQLGADRQLTVLVSFSVIELDDVARIVVTLQDITARKLAEESVRASEERFRLLVENSSELVLEVTLDGRVHYYSPNSAAITGFSDAELAGANLLELVHPDDLRKLTPKFSQPAASARFRARFADGAYHWLEASGRAFRLKTGEQRAVILARDVGEKVRAEAARQALEHQLREAQKLEALGTLASGIAHDFNNILAAIVAYAEMAYQEADSPEQVRENLVEVQSASGRAAELVRRILGFSRRHQQERIPLVLDRVLKEALRLLRSTLPTTIAIRVEISDSVPVVLADPGQIHQVVMNLATNAAHALGEQPGRIDVTLSAAEVGPERASERPNLAPGRYARLSVSDSGHGMPPATLAQIFEPFFTTKSQGKGTGLGLAVVQGIVQDHDGAIYVQSRVGQGTTFEIYLPEHDVEATLAEAPRTDYPHGAGERILLVDDEAALRKSIRLMLEHLGYRAVAAATPEEALERFRSNPRDFDAVLTDLTMPGMTGIDLAKRLLEFEPALPVALLSGFSGSWTSDGLREIGIRALIHKPATLAALALGVRQTLEHSSLR